MAKTSIISIAKLVVLNLFHIFATTVDSTAVEKNLLIMKFYNREKEIAELKRVQELAFGQNSRMIVVTGRRRIGKTSLIKQALKGTPTVYFFIGRKAESIYFYSGWHIQLYYFDTLSFRNRKNTFF